MLREQMPDRQLLLSRTVQNGPFWQQGDYDDDAALLLCNWDSSNMRARVCGERQEAYSYASILGRRVNT